jgi:ABC-type lipoprotein export system ATPase subunit
MTHSSRGSLWNRWDLHFHTPSSFDYHDKSVTNEQIVDRLKAEGVRVVAITDHHTMDIDRIRALQKLGGPELTVLPGMEVRDDHGGKPINYICIFPEDCDLDHVWTTLQGKLGLTSQAIHEKGGNDKVYVPIEDGAHAAIELGGVISIHAGGKSNSIEGISNKEQFQQRIKYDITRDWVDLLEIGQLKDIDAYLNVVFPGTGLEKPLIICSDNHDISDYYIKVPLWLRADPNFRGLLMVLREPFDRVSIGDRPPDEIRIEQNRTKYIRRIAFSKSASASTTEKWFDGSVEFNPGLIAIIGNKGSGKSALSDTLGLLGATKNSHSFSFLSDERFKHPRSGLASQFDATIEWESGEAVIRSLDETIEPEEVERVRYLPQDHVEHVCNELASLGESGFEKELRSVIFSRIPEAQRLGFTNLDELINFRTDEKQHRIDSLLRQLRELSRSRARLEEQMDPIVKLELEEKLKRRELELQTLDQAVPEKVANPADSGDAPVAGSLLESLRSLEGKKNTLLGQISAVTDSIGVSERRLAVSRRLIERLANFEKEFEVFKHSLAEDATELGIALDSLATLNVDTSAATRIRDEEMSRIDSSNEQLDADEPPGLKKQIVQLDQEIAAVQSQLDTPNRAYQAYLRAMTDWQQKRSSIEGSENDPESQKGIQAALVRLTHLPTEIDSLKLQQAEMASAIHGEKLEQAAVYRTFYGRVQEFIDTHPLAQERLRLEFRAELVSEDFENRLLGLLNQNRKGSFIGVEEGYSKAQSLVRATDWSDENSLLEFLNTVDNALHFDDRDEPPSEVQLKNQLIRGKRVEEVFDLLYGLEYVRPRYILRWEGKDLSMLSPGERGTLLLVFYLLIDTDDLPLIIDQPEGNLDNHTVAKVLVDCIKEARTHRQVFIVTHNPNLAVVCDADQVVHASIDKTDGNAITYLSGALENPEISQFVTDVLEGTRWAFGVRNSKYEVGE